MIRNRTFPWIVFFSRNTNLGSNYELYTYKLFCLLWFSFTYFTDFPGALITLSSFGISFERIRSLKTRTGRNGAYGGNYWLKTICVIWITAAIITFPSSLRTTNNLDRNSTASTSTLCKRVCLKKNRIFCFKYICHELFCNFRFHYSIPSFLTCFTSCWSFFSFTFFSLLISSMVSA